MEDEDSEIEDEDPLPDDQILDDLESSNQLRFNGLIALHRACTEVPSEFKTILRAVALTLQTQNEIKENKLYKMNKDERRAAKIRLAKGDFSSARKNVPPSVRSALRVSHWMLWHSFGKLQLQLIILRAELRLRNTNSCIYRYCYGPKLAIFNAFCELFPFVDLSRASNYRKMIDLEQPTNGTDICSFCHTVKLIIAAMKRANLSFSQLSPHKQAYIRLWRKHKIRSNYQCQAMHSDVFNVGLGEVVLIADFKENLHIVLNRDSEFVAHSCDGYDIHIKKVYTVLSLCLSHTAGFVLKCLKLIFDQDEFHSIEKAKWWSDNGPHFKNHDLVNALFDKQTPFINSIKFNVNFFASQHGKSECDSAFGFFNRFLKTSIPESGVQITCSKLPAKAKKLVVSNFSQSLSFTSSDGLLVFAPVSKPEEDQKVTSPFKSKLGEVSSKVKRSTAPVIIIDVFDELVKKQLEQLQKQLTDF
ncbi:MAG: hypothetical protein EZS28_007245 [Streblomastix strix]|uniref:Uncharacterized protein n=1 Tax=Streblomastix strix TaxID=222440 RepID=A0A5J4WQN7_9EUKA|nr:MAG: hypothetical protein EZS28_007245 [Streblomastix strix]